MDEAPRTSLRRSRRLPWALLAAALAGAGAYAAFLFLRADEQPPAGGAPDASASAPSATAEPAPPAPDERPVDAAGAKPLLEGVSDDTLFRKWLGEADLIRRIVLVIDNVAEGVSPRLPLRSLGPSSPFSVERRGEAFVIAPESYARYDAVARAIESLDARALASAYRRLRGVLEPAHRALGYPEASLDDVVGRALYRIESAPVAEGDVSVVDQGGVWTFTDARLERLRPVEKHLLRMGPRNTLRVQAKARELREALQLPARVASGTR